MVKRLLKDKKSAILSLFNVTEELRKHKIIRSTKIYGDIAEYICAELLDLKLESSQRQASYDATDASGQKYQIKFNNSSEKTNQEIGDKSYNFLLLVITSESRLFDKKQSGAFICIYRYTLNELAKKKRYIAKKFIAANLPILKLDSMLNVIPKIQ